MRAGRKFAGIGQLGLVLAGFVFLLIWMMKLIFRLYASELGNATTISAPGWLWKWGATCVIISWSWMLLTCWSLIRQARADEAEARRNLPPKLADLPPQNPENRQ